METSLLILAAMVLVPIILIMRLRINATLVFLSLCLGSVLTQYIADDAGWVASLFARDVPQAGSLTESTIKLGLLLLPVILTAIFMVRTVHGHGKLLLNLLPAAGVGLLGSLLVVPLLPEATANQLMGSPLWYEVSKLQDLIVGASAVLCLFVLWMQRPKTGHHDKHAEHKA